MNQPTTGRHGRVVKATARGLAAWLLVRLGHGKKQQPRLAMLERITLAPRHSLALVEADGRRLLVATSADSGPVFYALGSSHRPEIPTSATRRVSW